MVLASFGMLEVRELGVLEVWLSKLVKFLLVELVSHLPIQFMSSVLSMVGNGLHDTFQAVTVLDARNMVMAAVVSDGSLLLVDEILDLSELAP